jgi:aspartyl protease family protein
MTMGFMGRFSGVLERDAGLDGPGDDYKRSAWRGLCLAAGLWPFIVCGADVGLAGLFPGKVLLTINGGAPRIVAVGARTSEGVRVLGVDGDTATLEIDGRKRVLRVGQNVAEQAPAAGPARVVLTANAQGHFLTTGMVNGTSVRFMVDTGATLIAIGAGDARRIGIDPKSGARGISNTANGQVMVSRVKLDTVRIGDLVLNGVDAVVFPHEQSPALLGMSFLNRMEIQHSAGTMTLIKRY